MVGLSAPNSVRNRAIVRDASRPTSPLAHSLGDPFARCRDLQALGCSGRVGFHAASGGIGIVVAIDAGATLAVMGSDAQSVRFARWKPFPIARFPKVPVSSSKARG